MDSTPRSIFPENLLQEDAPASTIVAVDDVAMNLEIYQHVLQRLPNMRIVSFSSSASGLDWCKKNDFDLLLVDYHMPSPNGIEFVDHLRKLPTKTDIPIIMITVAQESDIRRNALDRGVSDFFIKPIDPVEFLARAKNLLLLRARGRYLHDQVGWLSNEIQNAIATITGREEETIERLTQAVRYRDRTLGKHLLRVSRAASHLGFTLGMEAKDRRLLGLAAMMHDVGHISTPSAILQKKQPLTQEERLIVQEHASVGYDILADSSAELLQLGAEIALSHHERWDGTGYPNGLAGEDISLPARIVAVCDVYEALVSARPHRPAMTFVEAARLIESGSGTQFDPSVVDAFRKVASDFIGLTTQYPDDAVLV
jgi:response regulator RpfG family c-di-GMP phosphodiesterase